MECSEEVSNINKRGTCINNGRQNSNNVKYSIQESENNSDSFSMQEAK